MKLPEVKQVWKVLKFVYKCKFQLNTIKGVNRTSIQGPLCEIMFY